MNIDKLERNAAVVKPIEMGNIGDTIRKELQGYFVSSNRNQAEAIVMKEIIQGPAVFSL